MSNFGIVLLTISTNFINMAKKSLEGGGPVGKPDGIDRMTNALFTGLIGIVLLCALVPVFISQIAGITLPDGVSWAGLEGFQSLAYLLPVIFLIGLIIMIVRFFSSSRE